MQHSVLFSSSVYTLLLAFFSQQHNYNTCLLLFIGSLILSLSADTLNLLPLCKHLRPFSHSNTLYRGQFTLLRHSPPFTAEPAHLTSYTVAQTQHISLHTSLSQQCYIPSYAILGSSILFLCCSVVNTSIIVMYLHYLSVPRHASSIPLLHLTWPLPLN